MSTSRRLEYPRVRITVGKYANEHALALELFARARLDRRSFEITITVQRVLCVWE